MRKKWKPFTVKNVLDLSEFMALKGTILAGGR